MAAQQKERHGIVRTKRHRATSAHNFDDTVVIPGLGRQLALMFGDEGLEKTKASDGTYFDAPSVNLDGYDHIVLCMSGGKDSIACLLNLIEMGVDLGRVECWHHLVDGREGTALAMDWPFMEEYNKKLSEAFGVPLYFSWLQGGFEGELLKRNAYSRPHCIETPDGLMVLERDTQRARVGTRLRFPQAAASLQTRWCSSALKIDVGRRALNNQPRFNGKKVLFITGERREESANRARYNQFERHVCDRRDGKKARHVDSWRPVLHWSEEQVWCALRRHGVTPPIPYRLGWGRSSCMKCIFNNAAILATLREHFPGSLETVAAYEEQFGTTISRSRISVVEVSRQAKPLKIDDEEAFIQATQSEYLLPVIQPVGNWRLPAGAFVKTGGPS